eukprot:9094809-Lingulodinium_polyedra.AAC.1
MEEGASEWGRDLSDTVEDSMGVNDGGDEDEGGGSADSDRSEPSATRRAAAAAAAALPQHPRRAAT